MFKNKLNYKLLNILMLVVILFLGFKTFEYWSGIVGKIISILIPFIISFAIAYSLYPCVRKLEQKGVRKRYSSWGSSYINTCCYSCTLLCYNSSNI